MTAQHILITGASSGLGTALAREYAHSGVVLGLLGRDATRLEQVATACRTQGALVETGTVDVTDADAMQDWITAFDARYPVDICIANAGISAGGGGTGESVAQMRRIIEVNLMGVLHTVQPLVPLMRGREKGKIALVGSLAGYRGLPTAPSYSISKAALRTYAQSLRTSLYRHHISVSLVTPGFIKTPLTDVNPFPMPFLMPPEKAARLIRMGIEKRKAFITFPWPMVTLAKLQNVLPEWLRSRIYGRIPNKPPTDV